MRKIIIVSTSTLLLLSLWVCAFAGISPSKGLPTVTVSGTNAQKWVPGSALTSTGNGGSAMCVDCHTRNPSTHAPPASFPGGTAFSYNFLGSHFVTRTFADTNTGGGYPGSVSGTRSNDYYVKLNTWTTTGVYSKFGRISGATLVSDNATGTGRQLICESCHNITRNFGRYKLLGSIDVAQNADNTYKLSGDSNLCAGCHGDMRRGLNNEPSYFDNTVAGNQHHRHYQPETPYGGAIAPLDASHTSELIKTGADYYGPPSKLWAASFGQLTMSGGGPINSTGRNAVYVSATNPGIKDAPFTAGMIIVDNTASLYCLSCHRAHNAVSSTSALILKTSNTGQVTWGGSTIPTNNSPGTGGDTWQALRRQSDFGNPTDFSTRIIKDDRPLCNGCHQLR